MNFNNYPKKYFILNKLGIFSLLVIVLGIGLLSNVYAVNPSSEVIKMVPGQTTAPLNIQASNGTSYLKNLASGELIIPKNHKFCLDASCVSYFVSDGSTISVNPGLSWSSISKSGSVLNDIGSPTSAYNFNGQQLNNVVIPSPTFSGNLTVSKSPLPNTEIDAGSGNSGQSYIFGIFGNNFYAKNGTTGQIKYSGTNASTVISNVLSDIKQNTNCSSTANDEHPCGGTIQFKAGAYPISITIPSSGITIKGDGQYSTVLQHDGNKPIITIHSTTNTPTISQVQIKDLTINGTGYTANGINCISANRTSNLIISTIYMTGCNHGNGIYMEQVWDSKILFSDFIYSNGNEALGYSPIYMYAGSNSNTDEIYIFQDHFERNGATAIRSVGTGSGINTNFGIMIVNSKVEEHGNNGNHEPNALVNFTRTQFSLVSNNLFVGSNKSQVWMDSHSSSNVISENHHAPSNSGSDCCISQYGIDIEGSNNSIMNNKFGGVSSTASIHLGSGATHAQIWGNTYSNTVGTTIDGSTNNNVIVSYGQIQGPSCINVGSESSGCNQSIVVTGGTGTNSTPGAIMINDFAQMAPFFGERANGNLTKPSPVLSDQTLASFSGRGYDNSTYSGDTARIQMRSSQTYSVGNHGGFLLLQTTPTGTTTIQDSMKLDNDGVASFMANRKVCLDGGSNGFTNVDCMNKVYLISPTSSQLNAYVNGALAINATTTKVTLQSGSGKYIKTPNLSSNDTVAGVNNDVVPMQNPFILPALMGQGFQLSATRTGVSAEVDCSSYYSPRSIVPLDVGVRVINSGGAGTNMRVVIYASGSQASNSVNLQNGALLWDSGNVTSVTTGLRDFSISTGTPTSLSALKGFFFVCIESPNNTFQYLGYGGAQTLNDLTGDRLWGSQFSNSGSFNTLPAIGPATTEDQSKSPWSAIRYTSIS